MTANGRLDPAFPPVFATPPATAMPPHAAWQLPEGVSAGTWDYAKSSSIATDYDDYFSRHGMFRLDQELAQQYFQPGRSVVDLGCGTGRAILPLVQQGLSGLAVDLSQPMLDEVKRKSLELGVPDEQLGCLRANLVQLDCVQDASFDYAMCLFSTLGMIRGRAARRQVLQHVRRILKPQGLFLFQVHNYWVHLFDPEGPWWMIRNAVRTFAKRDVQLGDKFYPYRGLPDMYLHSFTKRELRRELTGAGFRVREWIPLSAEQDARLNMPWLIDGLRASGWLVLAESLATS